MMLIIGLGNPGTKYLKNRHNVGHMFIDYLNSKFQTKNSKLFKTDTFMNDSGKFVVKAVRNTGVKDYSDLYIAHDDLDLKIGTYKIQFGVGPKVHNGIKSVEEALNTQAFWRIRIGVDNRDPDNRIPGEQYVLEDFTGEELEILKRVQDDIKKELYEKISHDLK